MSAPAQGKLSTAWPPSSLPHVLIKSPWLAACNAESGSSMPATHLPPRPALRASTSRSMACPRPTYCPRTSGSGTGTSRRIYLRTLPARSTSSICVPCPLSCSTSRSQPRWDDFSRCLVGLSNHITSFMQHKFYLPRSLPLTCCIQSRVVISSGASRTLSLSVRTKPGLTPRQRLYLNYTNYSLSKTHVQGRHGSLTFPPPWQQQVLSRWKWTRTTPLRIRHLHCTSAGS